jgi:osmotically-inducible protein OsmY
MPASQPAIVPVPYPVPGSSQSAPERSSVDVEKEVASKLLGDQELRSYTIDVNVSGGTATLSGHVQNDDLKTRAEKLARTVKGVHRIVNNITV